MEWFEETYHPRWRQRIKIEQVVFRGHTGLQELLVFDSLDFGRVLALDGVLQTTERDEFAYHEMITHVPLLAHGAAREVLIIGGGDGGTLEEVLKHPGIERVVLVELDPQVVEISKRYLGSISRGAFDDPRAELVFADGIEYVAETERAFDVVLVDSTDPVGPGEVLFGEAFYGDCRSRLHPGGILVSQSGNPFGEEQILASMLRRLHAHFADVGFYSCALPTYFGGPFAFGFASDDPAKRVLGVERLAERPIPAGLRCYSPAMHAAAFVHPPWLEEIAARALGVRPTRS